MPNRLIHSRSPYLRKSSHQPVDWYEWGDEAFEKAKREDKIFGGTYFPPEDRWGKPGFKKLLLKIARLWKEDRKGLLKYFIIF